MSIDMCYASAPESCPVLSFDSRSHGRIVVYSMALASKICGLKGDEIKIADDHVNLRAASQITSLDCPDSLSVPVIIRLAELLRFEKESELTFSNDTLAFPSQSTASEDIMSTSEIMQPALEDQENTIKSASEKSYYETIQSASENIQSASEKSVTKNIQSASENIQSASENIQSASENIQSAFENIQSASEQSASEIKSAVEGQHLPRARCRARRIAYRPSAPSRLSQYHYQDRSLRIAIKKFDIWKAMKSMQRFDSFFYFCYCMPKNVDLIC